MSRARTAAPLDARWAPALVTALLVGNLASQWSAAVSTAVSAGLLLLAVGAAAGCLLRPRGDRQRLRTAAGVLALAAAVGALVAQSVALRSADQERVGWESALQAAEPVRVALQVTGTPRESRSRVGGPRASVTVEVTAFGPHRRPLPEPVPAVLTGAEGWSRVAPGQRHCAVVEPRRQDGTVFLTAAADPRPGPCTRQSPGTATASEPSPPAGPDSSGADGSSGRERLRAAFRRQAEDAVGTAPELIPGLVLGDRSAQTPQTDQAMKDAGLSHLSAVSGANCALLAGVVTVLLRLVGIGRAGVLAGVLATLVVFVVVVGPEPSVLRAATMGGLGAMAVFGGRARQAFSLLCLAGTAVVIAVPGIATQAALHLSLAATAGIILGARPAEAWLYRLCGRLLPSWAARWLSVTLAVTGCAHLACQPILLAMTGTVSAYAVPANLLTAPAVAPVTVLGTLAAALVLALPPVTAVLVWLIQFPAGYIGAVAHTAAGMPHAVTAWPEGGLGLGLGLLTVAATVAVFAVLLVHERRPSAPVRRRGRSAPAACRRTGALGVLAVVLIAAGTGGYAAVLLPAPTGAAPQDWAVAFCDVGQGDMTVLRSGRDRAVVVDVGPEPEPASRCLDALGVEQVDAVLLTHLHADHTGGLAAVASRGRPVLRHATRGAGPEGGPAPAAGEEDTADPPPGSRRLRTADHERSGDVDWQVLLADRHAATENDASAQILATVQTAHGPLRVLLTGDIEEEAAAAWLAGRHRDAIPPPAQVHLYSVGHHGARNGGSALPRAVQAEAYVISAGQDNPYGHPHPQTLQALTPLGSVLRTDVSGTLVLTAGPDDAADSPSRPRPADGDRKSVV